MLCYGSAEEYLLNYREWIAAGFDSWDALAYCYLGRPGSGFDLDW